MPLYSKFIIRWLHKRVTLTEDSGVPCNILQQANSWWGSILLITLILVISYDPWCNKTKGLGNLIIVH